MTNVTTTKASKILRSLFSLIVDFYCSISQLMLQHRILHIDNSFRSDKTSHDRIQQNSIHQIDARSSFCGDCLSRAHLILMIEFVHAASVQILCLKWPSEHCLLLRALDGLKGLMQLDYPWKQSH